MTTKSLGLSKDGENPREWGGDGKQFMGLECHSLVVYVKTATQQQFALDVNKL